MRPSTTQSGFEACALGAITRARNSRAERLFPVSGENCTTTLLRCFSTIQGGAVTGCGSFACLLRYICWVRRMPKHLTAINHIVLCAER